MPTLDSPLVLAIALCVLVAIVNLSLTIFVVLRRAHRRQYFALKDQARDQLTGTVHEACRGSRDALRALKSYDDGATRDAIEELLLACVSANTHEIITHLLAELGYVARWKKRAFPRHHRGSVLMTRAADCIRKSRVFAVRRAIAVGHLGYLHRSIAAPLMIQALEDPSPLVISVAADSLARTGDPTGLTPLLDLLRRATDEVDVAPERGVKAALVTLRPDAHDVAKAYSRLESKRFRMAILDVLHELVDDVNTIPKLSNTDLLDSLQDADFEIRARAVRLIPVLTVERAAVRTALKDGSPLVRLRAVNVASVSGEEVCRHVHDEQWRVREAAVAELLKAYDDRRQQLLDTLLSTSDRYAAQQIMQQWQLSGELRLCLARLDEENALCDQLVCRKAVELGMDSMLIDALQPATPEALLMRLLEITHISQHPERASRLALLAQCSTERVSAVARKQLQQFEGTRTEVVGAA